jgi:hypothetical protein
MCQAVFSVTANGQITIKHYVLIYLSHEGPSLETSKFSLYSGLKISFTGPSDKMSDDFEFWSDICMMMSDDLQFSLARK